MSKWYYENRGERTGPVTAEDIRNLHLNGVLQRSTLVWTKEFGSTWKPLGETELAPPESAAAADGPPPLPSQAPIPTSVPSTGGAPQGSVDDFLTSDLTKALIGRKQEHYLAKWQKLLQKAGGDPKAVLQKTSWNWPAFFIPYGWLLYRKMYLAGGIIFAVQAIYALLPWDVPDGVDRAFGFGLFGVGIATAMYGNSWYFDATRKKWQALRSQGDARQALARAGTEGGVSLPLGIGSFALVIALAVVSFLRTEGVGIFASNMSCSSDNALSVVYRIAREQIDKDGYMMFVVDSKATKVSVTAIRTRSADTQQADCAGEISYDIAFKGGQNNAVKAALEAALTKQITYTVENTDNGDQIYVTVHGL